jgi:hypothetical protein
MVSESVGIREAFRTLGTLEAAYAIVEGLQMSPQCKTGGIRFLAVRIATELFLHLVWGSLLRNTKHLMSKSHTECSYSKLIEG